MGEHTDRPSAASGLLTFAKVFAEEVEVINFRRRAIADGRVAGLRQAFSTYPSLNESASDAPRRHLLVPRVDITADTSADDVTKASTKESLDEAGITGLALSGGGQRSATFCLGVLQGLDSLSNHDEPHVLDAIDYLSVVSGGGYIGTSLAVGLAQEDYSFPFDSRIDEKETPETQQLRNYSNFLAPSGVRDYAISAAYIVRGILVNLALVSPILFALAAFTKFLGSTPCELQLDEILGVPIDDRWYLPHLGAFTLSLCVFIVVAGVLFATSLITSYFYTVGSLRSREIMEYFLWALLSVLLLTTAVDAQIYVLRKLFGGASGLMTACEAFNNGKIATVQAGETTGGVSDQASAFNWFYGISAGLAALATALAALGQRLLNIARSTVGEASWTGYLKKYSSRIILYLAALVVPLLLWCMYLALSFWAIRIPDGLVQAFVPRALTDAVVSAKSLPGVFGRIFSRLQLIGVIYAIVAIAVAFICLFIGPNSNSLHAFYRDRLARAYLFWRVAVRRGEISKGTEKLPFSWLKRKSAVEEWDVAGASAPMLIVNTAINVEGSKELKKRGRKADTFSFSPLHVGSTRTGYVPITKMEKGANGRLTLATAIATSGAAASANMGRNTVRILTFSLALLNVRLGYWLPNPKKLALLKRSLLARVLSNIGFISFCQELLGFLNEEHRNVYLTDGGHIENLGIYELLRRRCKVILAVDAETDQELTFPSFTTLQIMARIDLGIRIELPWQAVRECGVKVTSAAPYGANGFPGSSGPHACIGLIRYNDDETGVIIYIKATMSGDEKDYIIDYKRRNATFPHETTLDQFFSEEQFEVYRALGFHSARGLFAESDSFGVPRTETENWGNEVRSALALLNIPPSMASGFLARSLA